MRPPGGGWVGRNGHSAGTPPPAGGTAGGLPRRGREPGAAASAERPRSRRGMGAAGGARVGVVARPGERTRPPARDLPAPTRAGQGLATKGRPGSRWLRRRTAVHGPQRPHPRHRKGFPLGPRPGGGRTVEHVPASVGAKWRGRPKPTKTPLPPPLAVPMLWLPGPSTLTMVPSPLAMAVLSVPSCALAKLPTPVALASLWSPSANAALFSPVAIANDPSPVALQVAVPCCTRTSPLVATILSLPIVCAETRVAACAETRGAGRSCRS
jgi:hypothetical protein